VTEATACWHHSIGAWPPPYALTPLLKPAHLIN
jgi:hypothetical protein